MMSVVRLVAACAVAGFLAACGGGDSSKTAGETSNPTSTTAAQTAAVVISIGGSGAVTSSPAGLDCVGPNGCTRSFPLGTTVALSAAAASGQTFIGWTGACSGSALKCAVVANGTQNVSA